jgi:hypothetical protein
METPQQETRAQPSHGGEVIEVETKYLDLDGDGVPDAVETVEVIAVDSTGDGATDTFEVVDEVASDIGIDGAPAHTDVVDTTTVELPENMESEV